MLPFASYSPTTLVFCSKNKANLSIRWLRSKMPLKRIQCPEYTWHITLITTALYCTSICGFHLNLNRNYSAITRWTEPYVGAGKLKSIGGRMNVCRGTQEAHIIQNDATELWWWYSHVTRRQERLCSTIVRWIINDMIDTTPFCSPG